MGNILINDHLKDQDGNGSHLQIIGCENGRMEDDCSWLRIMLEEGGGWGLDRRIKSRVGDLGRKLAGCSEVCRKLFLSVC
jgi:hypothetical protein